MQILTESVGTEHQRQLEAIEREVATLKTRNAELDSLFNRIYEDSVSGKIEVPDRAKVPQVDVCMPTRRGVAAHYSSDRKSA